MSKVKPQLARLLFIDRLLRNNRYPNCSTIAKDYEVSSKTVHRDIEYMRDMYEAPIDYDKGRKGYYYSEANYYLPAINIREEDLFAICIAEKALEQYQNTEVYDKLFHVFEKLRSYLPDEVTISTSWIDTKITFMEDSHTMIVPVIWEKISLSLRNQNQLKIIHRKSGGKPVSRNVDPYHIANYRGEWYLVAYCHRRRDVLRFAISRILEAELTGVPYSIPGDFDFKSFMGSSFGIMTETSELNVKILFSSSQASYVEERIWHPGQEISRKSDGSIVLSFTTNSWFEVKRWILSWGADARVLSPKKLADAVRMELDLAVKGYK